MRIRMAMKLNKLPSEIDAMPLTDTADLLEIMRVDTLLENE